MTMRCLKRNELMAEIENWDWWTEEKCISDVAGWKNRFPIVQEFAVSNDGEKIARAVVD